MRPQRLRCDLAARRAPRPGAPVQIRPGGCPCPPRAI